MFSWKGNKYIILNKPYINNNQKKKIAIVRFKDSSSLKFITNSWLTPNELYEITNDSGNKELIIDFQPMTVTCEKVK